MRGSSDGICHIVGVFQEVFSLTIKAADGPQKLRDLIDEFIRMM
jgi:hypothetical protein